MRVLCSLGAGICCRPPADKGTKRNASASPRPLAGAGARDGCAREGLCSGVSTRLVTPGLALRPWWWGCRTSSWSIMAKWLRFPPNQGPDPSLAYRPELDAETAKDKGGFRNYTVRTHSAPMPSSLSPGRPPHLCSAPLDPCPAPPPGCPWDAQGHTVRPGLGEAEAQGWPGRLTLWLAVRPAPGPRLHHLQAHAHAADGGLRQEEGTGRLLGHGSKGAERDRPGPRPGPS